MCWCESARTDISSVSPRSSCTVSSPCSQSESPVTGTSPPCSESSRSWPLCKNPQNSLTDTILSYRDIRWVKHTSNSTSARLLTNLLLMTDTRDLFFLTTPASSDRRGGVWSLMTSCLDWPLLTHHGDQSTVSRRVCVRYNPHNIALQ